MKELLLATTNNGKRKELFHLIGDRFEILLPTDLGLEMKVEETGTTFAENAVLKAESLGKLSGKMTFADDSGLEIDAMGGEPGIYSSRFGGEDSTYPEKFALIYDRLKDVPFEKRTARFRCAIALYIPGEETRVFEGKVEGIIANAPKGSNGFGYDPIFFVPEYGKCMAELDPDIKNQISHRANAIKLLVEYLNTSF